MRSAKTALDHRLRRMTQSAVHPGGLSSRRTAGEAATPDSMLDCGWGRLIFGHTFEDPHTLCEALRAEAPGCRDVAFYVGDPHVAIGLAPQELFLDPSHTYPLWMSDYPPRRRPAPELSLATRKSDV